MDTADWAQEAEGFLHRYHTDLLDAISEGTPAHDSETANDAATMSRIHESYFPQFDADNVRKLVQQNPILKQLDVTNLQSGPFELLENVRGWQPALRRLPDARDAKLVTMCRRDLRKSTRHGDNLVLVTRQHWSLVECLRCMRGCYTDDSALACLRNEFQTSNDHSLQQGVHKLKIEQSSDAGRYVSLDASCDQAAQPGDVLCTATPFVCAPYDFGEHSACFHCAKDLVSGKEDASMKSGLSQVRDLSHQCAMCGVSPLAYCSVSCRQSHQAQHERECAHIRPLVERSNFEKDRMFPFKALLVLRAALKAVEDPDGFRQLMELEDHAADHQQHHPKYVEHAKSISEWIVSDVLNEKDTKAILDAALPAERKGKCKDDGAVGKSSVADCLVKIFFMIHINAISLGPHAVGLFPGMPSMFNHKCMENVTHSWDVPMASSNEAKSVGGMLRFRAVEQINVGDECCISYVDGLTLPTSERTKALSSYKFFDCGCTRCQSSDEEGRCDAIQEWDTVQGAISNAAENERPSLQLYKRRCELADILYPSFFLSKGLVWEEFAHAVLDDMAERNEQKRKEEAIQYLQNARKQYATCRGEDSIFVARVDKALSSTLVVSNDENGEGNDDDDDDDNDAHEEEDPNADLKFASEGWAPELLEIKTYESLSDDQLEDLSSRIKASLHNTDAITWLPGHRSCEIGFGIRSLVIACEVNLAHLSTEEVAETIQDSFDDDVQHVDPISNTYE